MRKVQLLIKRVEAQIDGVEIQKAVEFIKRLNYRRIIKIGAIAFGAVFLLFLMLLAYANFSILRYKKYIVSPIDVPTSSVGLVFGGGVNDEGKLDSMPFDRVLAGVALYKLEKVKKLMMTGDDGQVRMNEVGAMSETARAYGLPKDDILIDPHGYRTYESCYREAKIYGINNVIAVSQEFHLPRIIYMCRHFGIETVGVAADFRGYGKDSVYMSVREMGARLKAWWQINITKPLPRKLTKEVN